MSSRRQAIDRPVATPNWGRNSFYALIDRLALISEGRYWAYFLLLPSMILLLAIIVYPIGSGILLSFRTMRLTRPDLGTPFIGLQHYSDLMQDSVFRLAARNTAIWVVLGASSQFVVGLITALALNRKVRGIWLIRILVLVPWFLPSVVAGHIWALMLDPRLGVINDLLVKVGILSQYRSWFSNPLTSLPTVLMVDLWRSFPYFSLFLLAGLQAIPEDLYEAASVDGAGYWQRFRKITMPLLAPVIVATVVLRVIGLVNSPDLLIVLTNGGPGNSTQVLSLFAFQTAYTAFNFGYAAAISVVILLLLMAFTIVYVRVSGATKG